jgi:hypothetical protein
VSRRIQIVLPDPAADALQELAAIEGTPPSTLAAQLVRGGLHPAGDGSRRPVRPLPASGRRDRTDRPAWLEPYGGSSTWRAETWGAIVALHTRYPRGLTALKDGWWGDQDHLETLCALAAWRAELDASGQDPREELAFQAQLADYAQSLKAEAGGVERAWRPGAPPPDWA